MSETPISKSQYRLSRVAHVTHFTTYRGAATALEAAGFSGDGLPKGQTWRQAGKLSDAELLAATRTRPVEDRWIDGQSGPQF